MRIIECHLSLQGVAGGSGSSAARASRHCTGHLAARRRLTRHEPAAGGQAQIAPVQSMHGIYIFHVGRRNVLAVLMQRSVKERRFHAPSLVDTSIGAVMDIWQWHTIGDTFHQSADMQTFRWIGLKAFHLLMLVEMKKGYSQNFSWSSLISFRDGIGAYALELILFSNYLPQTYSAGITTATI